MSFYNMLFGRNSQTALLLAVIGLRENDVERLRDVFASEDGSQVQVYTRTGGGNRDGYPQLAMRKLKSWRGSCDDDFDSTYCTDTFSVNPKWHKDVVGLSDVFKHGLRKAFAAHLSKTLRREPTESDKAVALFSAERERIQKTKHIMANGHTFVPLDDYSMRTALELAEKNGGELRSCWGILPLALTVSEWYIRWPNASDEKMRNTVERAVIDQAPHWKIDQRYWQHCLDVFSAEFPLTIAKIDKAVKDTLSRER